ncbi:MAG: chromate transporter [Lentisphaerae bacterium]|nr:chromate transporter [Lentisphaerota bacterium]
MSLHLLLFWTFFKISLFSIGGGYNMVPLIQHEVETRHWLPPGRFIDMLAVSEATPGPIAVNVATFAGYQVAGVSGATVATVGVCLPGAILLMALGLLIGPLRQKPAFRATMRGLMPVLVGLLAATALRLGHGLLPDAPTWAALLPPALIFAASLALIQWRQLPPLPLLAGAAATGILLQLIGI